MSDITSRWNEVAVRDRAQYLRTGRNKGVRAALAEAKRLEAEDRDKDTLPRNRRAFRRAAASVTA